MERAASSGVVTKARSVWTKPASHWASNAAPSGEVRAGSFWRSSAMRILLGRSLWIAVLMSRMSAQPSGISVPMPLTVRM